ncbi:hypothetical protein MGN70_013714 [Eutypa lata]|uniref:Uncharacterized protein n=1 Tax=Eutypa lata (strain UCR-EL1) TaxID=1287681 RepID=M7TF49_EUTLA|nr:hypothetical protein UCREL1_4432 [Eutypa lata UCREL1]KAI1243848.1 hypothetical protein MGN70_013714 [Eutypa lata]
MVNLIGTVVGIVVAVIVFTAIVLVLSLYWQKIFGRVSTEEKYSGSASDIEKGWPKSRDSTADSTWTVPTPGTSPRSSRTSDDPAMQKAYIKNEKQYS